MKPAEDLPIDELKALAHPVRFRIIHALASGERNVGEIEEDAGIAQPTLSQQLAVLRKAGLVDTRKQAKLVYYRLEAERFADIIKALETFTGEAPPYHGKQTRSFAPGVANFAQLA